MVKNFGGSKTKGYARKNCNSGKKDNTLRLIEEEGEVYAQVTKIFGGKMCQVITLDGTVMNCHIRGAFSRPRGKRDNFIAVLPITTPKYTASFDNNANFIYKTRNYAAPINLKKISIKMISPQGELVDLKQTDFAFCLQISTLYDNIAPFNVKDVNITNK